MKKNPTGFVAVCQCGVIVGAIDMERSDRKEAGQLLGRWLHDGYTVEPRFDDTWSTSIKSCRCHNPASKTPKPGEWWFSNDCSVRVYIHGLSGSGEPVYEIETGSVHTSSNWSNWHHEPDCTGWHWQPVQAGSTAVDVGTEGDACMEWCE